MKNFIKYFLRILFPGYILFSFFTLTNCSKNSEDDGQSYSKLLGHIKLTEQKLIQEFHAGTFNCNDINSLLNQKVILDSTIISVIKIEDGNYFKALINNPCNRKIYAILKCSQKAVCDYESFKSNRAFLVAFISKIESINRIAEADSLDGRTNFINENNSILLTADCLALAEIPIYTYQ